MASPVAASIQHLTRKGPNTTIAEFANTVDPDEMAHNELSVSSETTVFAI